MLTAEARVQTDRPGRYLTQLCQHLSNRGRHLGTGKGRLLRHRPGAALEFIENLISSHLGRFSRREPLTVTWVPAEALPAQPPPGGTVEAGGPA
jgi:hypothetical protein